MGVAGGKRKSHPAAMVKHATLKSLQHLTDAELVERLLDNNEEAIRFVFYDHFNSLLRYNAQKAAGNKQVEFNDLIQELFIYISKDNWEKLRKYNPQMPFANWFSVVSYRFFKDFTFSMIDSSQTVPIDHIDDHSELLKGDEMRTSIMMDIKNAIKKAEPPRDRQILEALLLNEEDPADVARNFNVTIDNLYNIKRRAIAKLIQRHLQDYIKR